MSEDTIIEAAPYDDHDIKTDELVQLKQRADMVGFKYHHKVGVDKLRKDLAAFMQGQNDDEAVAEEIEQPRKKVLTSVQPETPQSAKARRRAEAARLVRVRVSCMNPNKREWEGEIFTVSNSDVGTFKKYVPFNNEAGWHIPTIMLKMLQEKECQIFQTVNRPGPNGVMTKVREGKNIKEFNIEILPPLTEQELKDLANQQALARGQA